MLKKLLITLVVVATSASFAEEVEYRDPQMDQQDYEIETVDRHSANDSSDTTQEDYFKGANEADGTTASPQINIYNANSNANKQNQKAKVDGQAEAATDVAVSTEADVGNEYISRSNDVRNARKSMEIGTEQKVIEKIEWSRLDDERDRANRLFGNRLDRRDHDHDHDRKDEKIVIVEKPTYVTPAPVYAAPVREEIITERHDHDSWWGSDAYIAPLIGTTNYDAGNVDSNMSIGVAVGSRLDSNIGIEGSFLYSDATLADINYVGGPYYGEIYPGFKAVDQYNLNLGVKYNFNIGRIMPHIGALIGYTYRDYSDNVFGDYSATSNAFDAGLSAGVDFQLTRSFAIGGEFRWMKNLSYSRDGDEFGNGNIGPAGFQPRALGVNSTPLEEVDYQMFLVTGKFSF